MYIYRTRGICPAEIHFKLSAENILSDVRFVGGGCKGNAQLISRLLEGSGLTGVIPLLKGIECRNNTSCPDQLLYAIEMAQRGELEEAGSIRVYEDPGNHGRVAVIGELNGNRAALGAVLKGDAGAVYCLGNLTGPGGENDAVVEMACRERVIFALGPHDLTLPCKNPGNREILSRAPHYLSCKIGDRRVVGFYGGFIQEIAGFSDFSPHSLELLMVSNLSDYLRNEEVYPALQAMTGQFSSDVVLFAHTGLYRHVRLGNVDFVNVGPAEEGGVYKYALLKWGQGRLEVSFETAGQV